MVDERKSQWEQRNDRTAREFRRTSIGRTPLHTLGSCEGETKIRGQEKGYSREDPYGMGACVRDRALV